MQGVRAGARPSGRRAAREIGRLTTAGRPVLLDVAILHRRVKTGGDPLDGPREPEGEQGAEQEAQNFTITETTISTRRSVGTSFIIR